MTTPSVPSRRPRSVLARAVVLLALILGTVSAGPEAVARAAPSNPTPSSPTPSPASTRPATAGSPSEVTWGVAPADDQLGKNRAHFTYTLAPGAKVTDALRVVNRSKAPITLKVYASDGFTTSTGTLDLLPADQKPVDVGSWIVMKDSTVTLQPQQAATIPFTLTIPADATPGDHTGGVVTSLVSQDGPSSVSLDRRLGSRIYLRVPGTLTPALKLDGVHVDYHGTINPGSSGSATVTYTVVNTGNARLAAHQSIHVAGLFGALGRTVAVADLPELLPGSSLSQSFTVNGVWPGIHLTGTVKLAPVTGAVTVKDVTGRAGTWAWPWGQLIVLLIVIAAGSGYWWQRRRGKAAVAKAIATAVDKALAGSGPTAVGATSVAADPAGTGALKPPPTSSPDRHTDDDTG